MSRISFALLACSLLAAACGSSIGDACVQASDCAQDGSRICAKAPDGYCTVVGCDFGSCPDEAICVRFFPVIHLGKDCTSDAECAADETCTPAGGGKCAPRSLEVRYCMAGCSSHGDCRDKYECRNAERMRAHGGEPVPDPNATTSTAAPSFCAPSAECNIDKPCDLGDICTPFEGGAGFCVPQS